MAPRPRPEGAVQAADEKILAQPPQEWKHSKEEHEAARGHDGIGLDITGWGLAFNAAAHFAAYAPSGLVVLGALLGGYWHWNTVVVAWVILPILDIILGADSYNLTADEEKVWRESIWFRVVTWFHFPIQVALVTFSLYWISTNDLSWGEYIGMLLGLGTVEGFGIGCVHELIHRPSQLDLGFGIASLVWSTYSHFWIEHLWGHHRNVASRLDPATSTLDDNVYSFLPRCMWNSFTESLGIESNIQKKKGNSPWGLSNRIVRGWIASAIVISGYAYLFGVQVVPFFIAQGWIAAAIVENTNFIEHYGLSRVEIKPGKFQRVGWFHSWDTPNVLTNTLLFKIQRHPDHHTNASRPYQILRTYPEAPCLPTGYAGMIALSWFPPAYRFVMDWRAQVFQEQGEEFYRSGRTLDTEYPFPNGAQAVSSIYSAQDKDTLPSEEFEADNLNKLPKVATANSRVKRSVGWRVAALIGLTAVIAAPFAADNQDYLSTLTNGAIPPKTVTLWQRLGGEAKVRNLVSDIYDDHASDPVTAKYFVHSDADAVKASVFDFFAAGTGGPFEYKGKDMLETHKGLGITGTEFLRISDHVLENIDKFGYDKTVRDDVNVILYSLKDFIIEA